MIPGGLKSPSFPWLSAAGLEEIDGGRDNTAAARQEAVGVSSQEERERKCRSPWWRQEQTETREDTLAWGFGSSRAVSGTCHDSFRHRKGGFLTHVFRQLRHDEEDDQLGRTEMDTSETLQSFFCGANFCFLLKLIYSLLSESFIDKICEWSPYISRHLIYVYDCSLLLLLRLLYSMIHVSIGHPKTSNFLNLVQIIRINEGDK